VSAASQREAGGAERACYAVSILVRTIIAIVVSLFSLAGCARQTLVVPPRALPELAERQAVEYQWTKDGQRITELGPIRSVGITGDAASEEWFRAPFAAKIINGELEVSDEDHRSRRALRDIREIEVLYDVQRFEPHRGAEIAGIVLTSIGAAGVLAGAGVMVWSQTSPRDANALLLGTLVMVPSTPFLGAGIPLWVVGAGRPRYNPVPTFTPTRNGGVLRWAF
jgi:hypothetical protein